MYHNLHDRVFAHYLVEAEQGARRHVPVHRTAEVVRDDPQAPWSFPMAERREHNMVGLDEAGAPGTSQSGDLAAALPGSEGCDRAEGSVGEPGGGGTAAPPGQLSATGADHGYEDEPEAVPGITAVAPSTVLEDFALPWADEGGKPEIIDGMHVRASRGTLQPPESTP